MTPSVAVFLDMEQSREEWDLRHATWTIENAVSAELVIEGEPPIPIDLADRPSWFHNFTMVGWSARNITVNAIGSDGEKERDIKVCRLVPVTTPSPPPPVVRIESITVRYTDGHVDVLEVKAPATETSE